ncbi:MAG: DUF2235 domain-containing protein [Gammaproteobacteria bacterium]|nr:DUF2235 domain-containing protein [Gammaproteobacteria bacterium]
MALYAFDGTWNDQKDGGEYGKNTNVVRFRDAYSGQTYFYSGVGTRYGIIGKLLGGAFGVGGKDRMTRAMADLGDCWASGDHQIDIIGFSRGAALALNFANLIASQGVRDRSGKVIKAVPRIRFLGLWDVVAAFGIPIDIGVPFSRINLGYRLKLSPSVVRCYHALALDERRQSYRPTRVDADARVDAQAHEVWFRGVHSDVGGGNENSGLNDIAFYWMLCKAQANGLPIQSDKLAAAAAGRDPEAEIRPASTDPIKNPHRQLRAGDRLHYSVKPRQGERYNHPSVETQIEGETDERSA